MRPGEPRLGSVLVVEAGHGAPQFAQVTGGTTLAASLVAGTAPGTRLTVAPTLAGHLKTLKHQHSDSDTPHSYGLQLEDIFSWEEPSECVVQD